MKIAVVGGGGREHAIIKKLAESKASPKLYAIPGNGGIAALAECTDIKATDIASVVKFCKKTEVDYVVVAPDDPLAMGMVDALALAGIPAFGPTAAAARIEASKAFSKGLMKKYNIPTAKWGSFTTTAEGMDYIKTEGAYPVVIKADGLALGKGVVICQTEDEAEKALRSMLEEGAFGKSGSTVVIEEFLTGPEVSVLAFCDGKTLVPMVSSMDHKRAQDGDKGLNTGGMGAVAPNPFYTTQIARQCMEEIFIPTVNAMKSEGAPFKGCLYFGLMLTPNGPKVIEYNCRFGDPETQVVLPLLKSDLLEVMAACTRGDLKPEMVEFSPENAACVVLASGGYPEKYQTGLEIKGLPEAEAMPDAQIYHAGTKLEDGTVKTSGGRVLGVTATADTLEKAISTAYNAAEKISFEGAFYRKDIGQTALNAGK